MRSYLPLLVGWCIAAFFTACHKDNVQGPAPNPVSPAISNLQYSPSTVTLRLGQASFTISGTFDFSNAASGVASLRLVSGSSVNLTVPVSGVNVSQGTLQGVFELTMPGSPATLSFEVWIVDKQGHASNKLTGTIALVIDDSGTGWATVSQQWHLDKVAWLDNRFMALGQGGEILSSPDGRQWTPQVSGVSTSLFGIARSNTQWVVAGSFGTLLRSPDGLQWTPAASGANDVHLMSVAWSGTLWVAVGYAVPGNTPVILTSPDAITWTRNAFTRPLGNLNAVVWAYNRFVAVGKDYRPYIISSNDGLHWEDAAYTNELQGELVDVVWNGARFAAVGFEVVATSVDGLQWTFANASNMGLTGITWSGKQFLAVGITGIYRSTDGLNWSKASESPYLPRSVAWSGVGYVAVGFISPIILASPY